MKRRFWYWITDALAAAALLGATIFVLVRWQSIPAQVPVHFGSGGEITNYGNKASSLGLLLVVSWILFASTLVLSFFPQSWNVPRRTPRALQAAADGMAVLRFVIALFFVCLELCTALCRGLPVWILPALAVTVGGGLAYMLIQGFRR